MKIAFSGDWHLGLSGGIEQHNIDILEFTEWMIDICQQKNTNTFIQLGDFYDKRDKIDVLSLNYGIKIVDKLKNSFESVYMLKGNHDLLRRDSRAFSSINMFCDKIDVIDSVTHIDDNIILSPWLCNQQEYDELIDITNNVQSPYVFGHFEFQSFKMNEHYVMEHGQSHKELRNACRVISGHYHSYQEKDNVIYCGTPIPIGFGCANENNHGFGIIDTETNEIEFFVYEKIKIISATVPEFLEGNFELNKNVSVRLIIDNESTDDMIEQAQTIISENELRQTKLVYKLENNNDIIEGGTDDEIPNLTLIDDAVIYYIQNMADNSGIDKNLLVELYSLSKNL